MRHIIRIAGPVPVDAIVETTDTAVRLTFKFENDDQDGDTAILLLKPAEAIRLSTAIYDAVWPLVEAKRGDEERGPS